MTYGSIALKFFDNLRVDKHFKISTKIPMNFFFSELTEEFEYVEKILLNPVGAEPEVALVPTPQFNPLQHEEISFSNLLVGDPSIVEDLPHVEEGYSTGHISQGILSSGNNELLESASFGIAQNGDIPNYNGNSSTTSSAASRKECPTKNFLQQFKPIFLNYLVKEFGDEVINKYAVVKKIKNGGMYKDDVVKLFKEKDFKHAWEKMFAENIHVEMLMKTRIPEWKKMVYLSRAHVLEKAFKLKVFPKINELNIQI